MFERFAKSHSYLGHLGLSNQSLLLGCDLSGTALHLGGSGRSSGNGMSRQSPNSSICSRGRWKVLPLGGCRSRLALLEDTLGHGNMFEREIGGFE